MGSEHAENVLVIDDEHDLCLTLKKILEGEGYRVESTVDPGRELFPQGRFTPLHKIGVVLLDLKLNGNSSGLDYLSKIHEVDPHLPVIMITAHETIRSAVEAMSRGAFHYLAKPFDNEELKQLVSKAIEMRRLWWRLQELQSRADGECSLELLMGQSPVVQSLVRQVHQVAQTTLSVLLTGESGTGKELIAGSIHRISCRPGPMVTVDCASIPESLMEGELFGHEKGAFTGAHSLQRGKLELAHGGTLFLDEVANIPFHVQPKLLRFLETRECERLGGRTPIRVDIRVVAATNQELSQLVKERRFRGDLYYRLNEFPISLPPLRERSDDIPYLCLQFLKEFEGQVGKKMVGISPEALEVLQSHSWPGNVRELRNSLKKAMAIAHEKIEKTDLPAEVMNPPQLPSQGDMRIPIPQGLALREVLDETTSFVERKFILDALKRTRGRKGQAAKLLGIDEKTLYNKLREHKL